MIRIGLLALSLSLAGAAHAQAAAKPAAAAKKPPAKDDAGAAAAATAAAAAAEAEKQASEAAAAKATADSEAAAAAARAAEEQAASAEVNKARESALSARGLDARMRALADSLAIPLKRLPGDHRDQRFAVLPFENAGAEAEQRSLGLVVSDLVVTDLARDHRLGLVERSQIGKIMDELALQQSGAIDDKQALEVGKITGARGLIIGRVSDAGEEFIVSARAVDGETGAVLVAEDMKIPKAELVAFSANAVVLRSRSGAMFRSVIVPGWGQSYNDESVKGILFGAATGTLAASTVVVGGLGLYTGFVEYPNAGLNDEKTPPAERAALVQGTRERANAELTAAAVLAGMTAVVWGVNVADAWLSGVDTESLDAALAKN